MSASPRSGSSSQRTTGPRMLTWVYHSPSLSAVSATSGRWRIQSTRARPASMLSSTVPSSSTRYHVATDIGAPLGISTATTAGLGRANSSATWAGRGALGMSVILSRMPWLRRLRCASGARRPVDRFEGRLGRCPQHASAGEVGRGRLLQRPLGGRGGGRCRGDVGAATPAGPDVAGLLELAVGAGDGAGGQAEVDGELTHRRQTVTGCQDARPDEVGELAAQLLVGRGRVEHVDRDGGQGHRTGAPTGAGPPGSARGRSSTRIVGVSTSPASRPNAAPVARGPTTAAVHATTVWATPA